LRYGHTLTVTEVAEEDVLELRDASGAVELRLRLTEDGVVLQLEAARISLKAQQSIDLSADGDVRIQGARVFIN
jgi:hypothetical protein